MGTIPCMTGSENAEKKGQNPKIDISVAETACGLTFQADNYCFGTLIRSSMTLPVLWYILITCGWMCSGNVSGSVFQIQSRRKVAYMAVPCPWS